MLTDKLREGAQGRVFKILFWIIILSFIFAGVGNYLIPRLNTDPVAVGKYRVTAYDWNERYNQLTQTLNRLYGSRMQRLMEDPAYVRGLRMRVLDELVDNVALNSQTYESGIRVGDEQVKDEIRRDPRFQKDGRFSNEQFLAAVRNLGSSPDYYAEQLRTSLMTASLSDPIVKASALPLPYELDLLAGLFAQVRTVDLYSLDPAALRDSLETDEALAREFYDAHQELFLKNESADLTYVVLSVAELRRQAAGSPEELEEYYRLNQDEFVIPERRAASQILLKPSDDLRERAERALAELAGGADFAELAARVSDDPDAASSRGSLGVLARGALSRELDEALFALAEPGAVSGIIYDDYGAHILRLDAVEDARVPDFAEIGAEVGERYAARRALELYADKAATLADVSFENPDSLEAAAEAVGAEVRRADDVSAGSPAAAWPLGEEEFLRAAFDEDNRLSHLNSQVISLGDEACAVLNVSAYRPAVLLPFEEVRERAFSLAEEDLAARTARGILSEYERALAADPAAAPPEKVLKRENVRIARSGGEDPAFALRIFAIPAAPGQSAIGERAGIPVLAVLREVGLDREHGLESYRELIGSQLARYKEEAARRLLYCGARELTEVTYNEDAIKLVNQEINVSE